MKKFYISLAVVGIFIGLACCKRESLPEEVTSPLAETILQRAEVDMTAEPVTVTSYVAERSAGGLHDFYSEGDYWWPDSLNPDGPYVRRDGCTNPENFVHHRHAMIRFSNIVGNLTSAYLLTGDEKYLEPIMKHVRAWMIDENTRMNPNLKYAQAIKGITTGRGIGIIDTIQLIEVIQSLIRLEEMGVLPADIAAGSKQWTREYLTWLTNDPNGIDEMNATNNHGTCWAMQAAIFAKYVGDKEWMDKCADRFKNIFLVNQMASDGSFPREIGRTKPYGYSLFNLDAMATICQILSTKNDNLWEYTTSDGKCMRKAIDFMQPYIDDKESWPYTHDVMYWDEWPVAHPAMLFAWSQWGDESLLSTWASQEHFPINDEVIRNLPVRNPLIWL